MEPDSGRKQTNTECAGVAQGFAGDRRMEGRGERWAEGLNLTGLMPEHVDICLHCVRPPQTVVPGRISGLRGGASPPPQRAREEASSGSHGWFPPGYHPSALSSIPLGTFSPSSRAGSGQVPGSLAAPGSGACLLQAGRILDLPLGCTQHWQPAQCPHTTAAS